MFHSPGKRDIIVRYNRSGNMQSPELDSVVSTFQKFKYYCSQYSGFLGDEFKHQLGISKAIPRHTLIFEIFSLH